jgi:hypothetical protein
VWGAKNFEGRWKHFRRPFYKGVAEAIDSTEGFTFLIAALKVFLEPAIEPNFVVDHAPDSLTEGWTSRRAAGSSRS